MLSIAHLSDAQRMFFVTTLLSEVLAWMRTQSGTSSLRALLYMDEIFGYFPPSAAPPSKLPMLTLLKQARAFGVGVLLATQNPVDLDYKGLANTGTWFIGRLQTERDKLRVLDGLQGAMDAASHAFDRKSIDALLSGLGSRVFLLNNVHEDAPETFQTRWTLSYLAGPLSKDQVQQLTAKTGAPSGRYGVREAAPRPGKPTSAQRPGASRGNLRGLPPRDARLPVRSATGRRSLAEARLHYVDKKSAIDTWQSVSLLAPVDGSTVGWDDGRGAPRGRAGPPRHRSARRSDLRGGPRLAHQRRELGGVEESRWARRSTSRVRSSSTAATPSTPSPRRGRRVADFKSRLIHSGREQRDADVEALRKRYAPKLQQAQAAVQRAEKALSDQKAQASGQTLDTVVTVGTTLLGAFLGRKLASVTNMNRARTALRSGSRTVKEREDVATANQQLASAQQRLADPEAEFQEETDKLEVASAPEELKVVEFTIPAKKSDIAVGQLVLAWSPWRAGSDGMPAPATALG